MSKLAYLFPAFVGEFTGKEIEILSKYNINFKNILKEASEIINEDITGFHIRNNNFLKDELKSQYLAYLISCAVSEILGRGYHKADYTAGYSMGLYATLYHTDSIDFSTGLLLIKNAFEIINSESSGKEFCMGSVIGLDLIDLKAIIDTFSGNVEIINTNGEYSYVLSGVSDDLKSSLEIAKSEGALHTNSLSVSCPYHSTFIIKQARKFDEYLDTVEIKNSEIDIVSLVDQRVFNAKEEIRKELRNNIDHSINWLATMNKMLSLNINTYLECGAGKSLFKIGKFIAGDFKISTIGKIEDFKK